MVDGSNLKVFPKRADLSKPFKEVKSKERFSKSIQCVGQKNRVGSFPVIKRGGRKTPKQLRVQGISGRSYRGTLIKDLLCA